MENLMFQQGDTFTARNFDKSKLLKKVGQQGRQSIYIVDLLS